MKSPATFLSCAGALALALVAVARLAIGDQPAPRSYSVWRGPVVVEGSLERLAATFAAVTVNGEVVVVGTLADADGARLSYVDSPLDDRPLVAVLRAPIEGIGLVELWSDGTCDHLELLHETRRVPLWQSAWRIVEAMPKATAEALHTLQGDPVMQRPAAELASAFERASESDEQPAATALYDEDACPELFEHLRMKVLDRFATSRAVIVALASVKPSLRLERVAVSLEEESSANPAGDH